MKLIPDSLRFWNGSLREEISGLENPSVDLVAAITAAVDGATSSNVSMTPLKAFRQSAVYACVTIVAPAVASLPAEVLQDDESGGRELVLDDPRWNLLNGFPNPEMTGMELVENWVAHAMLWGVGYLYVVSNGQGMPVELWPLMPDTTKPRRAQGTNKLYYETEIPGSHDKVKLMPEQVIPLHATMGISPSMNARDMLASAAAAQQHAGRFWQNSARPGGVIELPEGMSEDEMDEFVRRWKAGHEGLKRSQLVGILTGGAQWKDVGISPEAAQMLETRKFAAQEIAMIYGVPPHRIGIIEPGMSRISLEQQSIEFVTYTLRQWLVRAEQALRQKLFVGKDDIANHRLVRFNVNELMRGDIHSRYGAYSIGVQWGFLNRAEVRRKEGEPTVDSKYLLDEFLVPLNMLPASKLDEVEVGSKEVMAGGGGDKNKDGGGTQPTTGSDGSTPQKNADEFDEEDELREQLHHARSLANLALMMRDNPELADHLAAIAADPPTEADCAACGRKAVRLNSRGEYRKHYTDADGKKTLCLTSGLLPPPVSAG